MLCPHPVGMKSISQLLLRCSAMAALCLALDQSDSHIAMGQMAMPAAPPGIEAHQAPIAGQQAISSYPYMNPLLPISQRVDDLVARMSLQEKVLQMQTDAPAIPRLGIPEYGWWSESLHGFTGGEGTVFPEPIGLGATWDIPLESSVASAISDEDRAAYNATGLLGNPQRFHGLTFFAPNINIFRDPRWGRGQETYGEDPYLTAQFGVTFIKGLQGNNPKYLKLIATPKHFAVHSGPEPLRHQFDAEVSDYDLNDTYLPAFKAAITRGHAYSIMGAYSSVDGVPDCANSFLLQTTLRQKWGFTGYVVSDCGAIDDIYSHHHYASSEAEAAADAVKAGCDITCGTEYASLTDAVTQNLISEAQIDVSLKRLMTARMRLGMFDPVSEVPYNSIPASQIDSDAHRQIARQAARESIVLLKNDRNILPLDIKTIHSIAVIGPNADSQRVLLGNYNGYSLKQVSVLDGLRARAAKANIRVDYAQGSELTSLTATDIVPMGLLHTSDGQPGVKGEYFDGRATPDAIAVARRQDPNVDFNWTGSKPDVAGLSSDRYSVRWSGLFVPTTTGLYTFGVRAVGFAILSLDGKIVAATRGGFRSGPSNAQTASFSTTFTAGVPVNIQVTYFHFNGGASVQLLWRKPDASPFSDAISAAENDDAVVFVGGISSDIEGEEGTNGGGDRADIDLPQVQDYLLKALAATGKPVIMVLMNGSAIAVNWAQAHVPAIIEAWYPGEEGGDAVADVLFGDYDPAGRLPVTFYRSLNQLPPFEDYSMKARTYRYFTGDPLYPFGYGLSYTSFDYRSPSVPHHAAPNSPVEVAATVRNAGRVAGDEVVECYLRPDPTIPDEQRMIDNAQPMPRLILAGFQRIHLVPGESKRVVFTLDQGQLCLVDSKGIRDLQPSSWQIFIGGQQPNLTGKQPANVVGGPLIMR
jgi:beta-glucosidase